ASELSEDVSVVETSEDSVVAETAPADAEVNNDAVVETANETSDNSSNEVSEITETESELADNDIDLSETDSKTEDSVEADTTSMDKEVENEDFIITEEDRVNEIKSCRININYTKEIDPLFTEEDTEPYVELFSSFDVKYDSSLVLDDTLSYELSEILSQVDIPDTLTMGMDIQASISFDGDITIVSVETTEPVITEVEYTLYTKEDVEPSDDANTDIDESQNDIDSSNIDTKEFQETDASTVNTTTEDVSESTTESESKETFDIKIEDESLPEAIVEVEEE
ncbi:MAG: hypothetical protein K6E79_10180, partial [Pseudobutyrivibrio sp.]|nr:hypothetical protein [Pseudobutyrivibrio sp.]